MTTVIPIPSMTTITMNMNMPAGQNKRPDSSRKRACVVLEPVEPKAKPGVV